MSIKRYLRLYKVYLTCAIKSRLEYKKDAIVGIISFLITNVVSFSTLMFVVSSIPSLNGWTKYELGLLYGFAMIPKALDHMFTDSLWYLGYWYIKNGEVDRYLIKPVNALFQIIAEVFQPEAFGEAILGVTLIIICAANTSINFTLPVIVMIVAAFILGAILFTSLKLITCSISFWTKRSGQMMSMVYNVSDFVKYPIGIYHPVIKFLLAFIIPFGMVISIPVDTMIKGTYNAWSVIGGMIMVDVIFVILGITIWNAGLKRYESAGN